MATRRWIGGAPSQSQVSSATLTGYDATTTYVVSIGSVYTVSVLGQGGSVATTAVALLAALQSPAAPAPFSEIIWTNPSGGIITGTARTPGIPFTVASSVSGGGGTFGAFSTTTANAGPNVFSTAANWTGATVPVSTDTIVFDQSSSWDCLYDLDQHTVLPTALIATSGFAPGQQGQGTIGLPEVNTTGAVAYPEYRPTFLKLGCTTVTIGDGPGNGSGRIKLDNGSTAVVWNVRNSGSPAENNLEAILLKGTNAANVLNNTGGSVGVAVFGGDVSTLVTINLGAAGSSNASLRMGSGVTLSGCTLTQLGGTCLLQSALATLLMDGGACTILGTGALATATINAGATLEYDSNGTITAATVSGTLDLGQDMRGLTITTLTLHRGFSFLDPARRTTLGAGGLTFSNCSPADGTLTIGPNITLPSITYL